MRIFASFTLNFRRRLQLDLPEQLERRPRRHRPSLARVIFVDRPVAAAVAAVPIDDVPIPLMRNYYDNLRRRRRRS